jgi:hypothetical protein
MPCSVPYCSNIATTGTYFFSVSATPPHYLMLCAKNPQNNTPTFHGAEHQYFATGQNVTPGDSPALPPEPRIPSKKPSTGAKAASPT